MNEAMLMIILRLVHILGGIFWAGTALLIAWFLIPAHRSTGAAGMTFINELMIRRKLRFHLTLAMILTILSGLGMYARMIAVSDGQWASTTMAKILGFGAIAGIIAGGLGGFVSGSIAAKMAALGKTIQDSGQPPTETQNVQMETHQDTMQSVMRIVAVLLLIAVAAMASARYL